MLERIQKIISAAGVTSRRAAEQLILEGRVRVNGQVVTELGTKADAAKDHIKVDGKLINPRQPMTYIMLNKPAGYVTTMSDPEGRTTVLNLLKGVKVRVYPVGRLDYNTEGLLLLTNDGDFAHLVTHPKHEFPKTYRAKVKGVLEDRQIAELEKGIYLDDGRTAPAKLKKISREEANSWLEITIHEGKKRQVRRMFDRVGHSVIKLKRIRTGNLVLGDLPEGAFRYLTPVEVQALKELAVKEQRSEGQGLRDKGHGVPAEARSEVRRQEAGVSRRKDQRAMGRVQGVSAGSRFRGISSPSPGDARLRAEQSHAKTPGSAARGERRRPSPGGRVPGQGASGRGPRRPPRDEGKRQNRGVWFTGTGAGKNSDIDTKRQRPTGTRRPEQESRDAGATKRISFKPKGKKTTAARMRGKIFHKSSPSQAGAELTEGPRDGDRKFQRSYKREETGKKTAPDAPIRPFRPKK